MSAGRGRASWREDPARGGGAAGTRRLPGSARADGSRFDAAYYRRFYGAAATRVHGPRDIARLARGVTGIAGWLGVELGSVLDVGAGIGLWRDWFRRHRPQVDYRSIDVSPHACSVYGHERRDISRWRAARRFDLVVCHGVLQYLGEAAAERAIDNLGAMCRGLLYLEVLAEEDRSVLDPAATDMAIHLRPARWYRERLERHFAQVGAGLWASRRSGVRLYALEGAGGSLSPPRAAPCPSPGTSAPCSGARSPARGGGGRRRSRP